MPKQQDPSRLDKAIEELENAIIGGDPETEKYTKMVSSLEILYKLKNGHKPSKLEIKDWMPIIGSLSGILVICLFEAYGHTIVSKGLGFVQKAKA
ncbi:hypothetical protein PBI_CAMILLE_30 [Microbacterium phage Camille]|nr:hypothetical protein PBI_CAMILLE_30 [Microbacterium phage Camille]